MGEIILNNKKWQAPTLRSGRHRQQESFPIASASALPEHRA